MESLKVVCYLNFLIIRINYIQGIMKIMDGVESNLSHKNRDRFSSNVSQFKRELSQHLNGRRSSDIVDLHSGNNNISMNNGSKSLRTINSTPSLFVNSKNQ